MMENLLFTGFGDEYFKMREDGDCKEDKSLLQGYKSVLNSKNNEDALVGEKDLVLLPSSFGRLVFLVLVSSINLLCC